jgi:hypothetical protein
MRVHNHLLRKKLWDIVAPLALVSARLSKLVIHQGQQNQMNFNTIEALWTINNNNENMFNLILMSHK